MTDALHRGHLLTSRSRSTHSGHHRRGTQGETKEAASRGSDPLSARRLSRGRRAPIHRFSAGWGGVLGKGPPTPNSALASLSRHYPDAGEHRPPSHAHSQTNHAPSKTPPIHKVTPTQKATPRPSSHAHPQSHALSAKSSPPGPVPPTKPHPLSKSRPVHKPTTPTHKPRPTAKSRPPHKPRPLIKPRHTTPTNAALPLLPSHAPLAKPRPFGCGPLKGRVGAGRRPCCQCQCQFLRTQLSRSGAGRDPPSLLRRPARAPEELAGGRTVGAPRRDPAIAEREPSDFAIALPALALPPSGPRSVPPRPKPGLG